MGYNVKESKINTASASSVTNIKLEASWKEVLKGEFEKDYFRNLRAFVHEEYRKGAVYPPAKYIFRALDECPFENVRVVILGQDPYHGKGQANGLCFAVNEGLALPPSLQNIYKEIEEDLGKPVEKDGDLLRWTEQGVLLLNSVLTVRASSPISHQRKGWEEFTDAIVSVLAEKREHLVFMLWGRYAKDKGSTIDFEKHLVLTSAHPSPYSAASGFFGSRHFSQANEYLKKHGTEPIKW